MVRAFEEFFTEKKKDTNLLAVMEQRFEENALAQSQMMQVIGGLYEALKESYNHVAESNAYIKRVEEQVLSMRSDITSVTEKTSDILSLATESRAKHFIGKEVEVLESASELAKTVSYEEARMMATSATKNQPEGRRELYGKIFAMTGYAVWKQPKRRITKHDGLEENGKAYTNPSVTWINTLFLEGYKDTVYIVSKEMLN